MKIVKKSKFSKYIRNFLGYRPALTIINSNIKNLSTSDAFFWRTDSSFKTIFRYTDIFKLFFNDPTSKAEIIFYDRNSKFLKKIIFEDLDLSNQLVIDKNFMNNLEDYGTFYIYHFSENTKDLNNKDIISNRCYLGYSQNNNLHTFVHGNTFAKFSNINSNGEILTNIVKTSLFKNQKYTIQKYFRDFDKNEFIGREALIKADPKNRSWGLRVEKGIALRGRYLEQDGIVKGRVTSSSWSPFQECGIGIVLLDETNVEEGTQFQVLCNDGEMHLAEICTLPMYDTNREIVRGKKVDIPLSPRPWKAS